MPFASVWSKKDFVLRELTQEDWDKIFSVLPEGRQSRRRAALEKLHSNRNEWISLYRSVCDALNGRFRESKLPYKLVSIGHGEVYFRIYVLRGR